MSVCTPTPDTNTLVALLAAGQGRRFGGGKLDATCAGRPLGAWAARAAEDAGFASRVVVASRHRPAFVDRLRGWRVVTNSASDESLASSVRTAARSAKGYARLIIILGDMPLIEAGHLRALSDAPDVAFTAYPDGDYGVPASFPAHCFDTLAELTGRATSVEWGERLTRVRPRSFQSLFDVDTPDDLETAHRLLLPRA